MARPSFRRPSGEVTGSAKQDNTFHAGEMRQSQLITTFGIGSMVDYVKDTVIIAATDLWDDKSEDAESRKLYNANLSALTGKKFFLSPKSAKKMTDFSRTKDIPSFIFPEKLYCPGCHRIYDVKELAGQTAHNHNKCTDPRCRSQLVPSRFVLVCANGHMEDFPYSWWVHRGRSCTKSSFPRLSMWNRDHRSEMESLVVKCEDCGADRVIYPAFSEGALKGYKCNSYFPHLNNPRFFAEQGWTCDEPLKAMHRTSTGVYFSVAQSALSIPPWSKDVVKVILADYEILSEGVAEDKLIAVIRKRLPSDLATTVTDEVIEHSWEVVRERKNEKIARTEQAILLDEYTVLSKADNGEEGDREFSSYRGKVPERYSSLIDDVVIVDKLTEIQAFQGFRRVHRGARIARISIKNLDWLPAIQLNGEGIFIRFNAKAVEDWAMRNSHRYEKMTANVKKSFLPCEKYSERYVMLHTFAHLLIRQISAKCGYNMASIKEKIYSTFRDSDEGNEMYGVLIYVSSSDCDSSLGGLISVANDTSLFGNLLDTMLEKALWCSADPLCIISLEQGSYSMNYAACHDCVLLPETSCEHFNTMLDRVAIVGAPDDRKLGFFYELLPAANSFQLLNK